jgi:uracil-DNA glycosylase family 4
MRNALHVLTDELRRLKASGVKTVHVPDETLAALRQAMHPQSGEREVESGKNERITPEVETTAASAGKIAPEIVTPEPPKVYSTLRSPPSASRAPSLLPPPPVFALPEGDKATRWAWLRDRVLGDPVCCAHMRPGKKVVFGVGSIDARIMFVGEAPGADEEVQGEPFVGPAGQLLTRMIQAMGLQRPQVYIGNIMNWRPELPPGPDGRQYGNREPTEEEMTYCLPYLRAQIDVIAPTILVALGATASKGLLGMRAFKTLGEVRGRWHEYCGRPLMVTYHPSYLLRKEAESKLGERRAKRAAWEDFLLVMQRAGLPISDKQRAYFLDK